MIDANSQFFAILTNVGMAKQANADALGIPWKLTEMGVGDANPNGLADPPNPIPSADQTKLLNEWRRKPLNQLKIDPVNPAVIIAEQIIPADEGGKWLREIGLYDADGDLVAVANCAPSFKPLLSQGSGRTQVVRMNFVVSNTGNITLKIDPAVVLATREYVDSRLLDELSRLDIKQSVRAATTANIALLGLQVVDGVSLSAGDRVLVKNQTVAKDNGPYVVAVGAWTRAKDADSNAKVTPNMTLAVEVGTTQADTIWQLVTDGAIVVGVTALTFKDITDGLARLFSPSFVGNPTAPTPAQFDSGGSLVTTAFAKRMGVEYSGLASVSVSTVLANSIIGGVVSASSVTPINVTLPPTAGVPLGATIEVVNAGGGGAVTVLASGGDGLTAQSGLVVPVVLGAGDNAYFIKVTGEWRLRGGSASLKYSALLSGQNWITQPQFDNSKAMATTEFVQRAAGSLAGYANYSASKVLTAADVGKYVYAGAAAMTLTLPDATVLPAGSRIYIQAGSSTTCNVQSINGNFSGPNGNPGGSSNLVLTPGVATEFVTTGAGWLAVGGSGLALLSANGYRKDPSGLIEQWGTVTIQDNFEVFPTLPTVFPNAILGAMASLSNSAAAGPAEFASVGARKNGTSLSTLAVNANTGPTVSVNQIVTWRAWGY